MAAAQSRAQERPRTSVPADGAHGSHGRQVCRRHELYVSFQDLGWLVMSPLPSLPNDDPPEGQVSLQEGVDLGDFFSSYYFLLSFPSFLKGECVTLAFW